MNRGLAALGALGLVAAAPWAQAAAPPAPAPSPWTTTFTGETVRGLRPGALGRTAVVGAGAPDADLAAARAALASALTAAGVEILSLAEGETWNLDDVAVNARCAAAHPDSVVIVRVFPGAAGEPLRAALSTYDGAGKPLTSLSALAGSPLATPEDAALAVAGSRPSGQTITGIIRHAPPDPAAEKRFLEERFGIVETHYVDRKARTLGVDQHLWWPYRGYVDRTVGLSDFLRDMGRPDLAAAQTRRTRVRTSLVLGGLALALGGFGYSLYALSQYADCTDNGGFMSTSHCSAQGAVVGGLLGLLGTAALVTGGFMDATTTSVGEAKEMARLYNERLRSRLGLGAR